MKKKLATALLTMLTIVAAMPMSVLAEEEEDKRVAYDGQSRSVQAVATVTEDQWNLSGLNVVVSCPVTIPLEFNNGMFVGSGNIYMYGVLAEDNILTVTIDTTDTDNYKVVKYRKGEGASVTYETVDAKYINWIICNTSGNAKDGFTRQYGIDNLVAKRAVQDIPYNVELNAEIRGLIPANGLGDYVMDIPLKIGITSE